MRILSPKEKVRILRIIQDENLSKSQLVERFGLCKSTAVNLRKEAKGASNVSL